MSARPEQHSHSEPVRTTFVGISIEFRAAYRHTDRSFAPFSGIHPRKVALLTGGLPRQCAHWLAMTGNSGSECPVLTARQIPIYRTTERYRAGQGRNDHRPVSSRLVCGDSPSNSSLSRSPITPPSLFCHSIRKKSGAADLPPLICSILLESAAKRHLNFQLSTFN